MLLQGIKGHPQLTQNLLFNAKSTTLNSLICSSNYTRLHSSAEQVLFT